MVLIFHMCNNYAWIFWFISKKAEYAKMGSKNQLKMFFCMIISYTSNLHLKLIFLNLMNWKIAKQFNEKIVFCVAFSFKISWFKNFHVIYFFIKLT
jgi:hypothetical protein